MESNKDLTPLETPEAPQQNDDTVAPKHTVHHNWITDLYDRMNISVKALDIMIVVLMVFIIGVIVIASQNT